MLRAFPVNIVTFEPPEAFEITIRFDPRTVELGPIVTPLRTPKVPNVAKGTAKVSVENKAFPLTCREVVGLVVPIPTQAFELITTIFCPPAMFENTATFEPIVPGPTLRVLVATTFVVLRELLAYTLPTTWRFAVGSPVPIPIHAYLGKTTTLEPPAVAPFPMAVELLNNADAIAPIAVA